VEFRLLMIIHCRVIFLTLRDWFRRIEVRPPGWRVGFTRALSLIEVDIVLEVYRVGGCVDYLVDIVLPKCVCILLKMYAFVLSEFILYSYF
jgi:hypothetical protein